MVLQQLPQVQNPPGLNPGVAGLAHGGETQEGMSSHLLSAALCVRALKAGIALSHRSVSQCSWGRSQSPGSRSCFRRLS